MRPLVPLFTCWGPHLLCAKTLAATPPRELKHPRVGDSVRLLKSLALRTCQMHLRSFAVTENWETSCFPRVEPSWLTWLSRATHKPAHLVGLWVGIPPPPSYPTPKVYGGGILIGLSLKGIQRTGDPPTPNKKMQKLYYWNVYFVMFRSRKIFWKTWRGEMC